MGSAGFEPEDDTTTVKSARRVLQILEHFKEVGHPMSTTDIAAQLNFPISSTAALLKSLVNLGYLFFDRDTRTYQASLRVGLLGGWTHEDKSTLTRLNEITAKLADDSRQTIALAIRNEIHVQYIRVLAAQAKVRFYLPVGSRQRLVDTSMGRALLSLDDDQTIDRLVRRANANRTEDQPRIDPVAMRDEIAAIRRNGYAYSSNAFFKGAATIAVALKLSDHEPPLVLGLGGEAGEVNSELPRLIKLTCEAARAIGPAGRVAGELPRELRPVGDLCFA